MQKWNIFELVAMTPLAPLPLRRASSGSRRSSCSHPVLKISILSGLRIHRNRSNLTWSKGIASTLLDLFKILIRFSLRKTLINPLRKNLQRNNHFLVLLMISISRMVWKNTPLNIMLMIIKWVNLVSSHNFQASIRLSKNQVMMLKKRLRNWIFLL